ncbi:protein JINGUBANG [Senna tora]|uniref:Protein JINGUBANG n=1 Tax=Senna tora TaxID=362788 RepID=A0A834SRN0_9FABA|nr:protein JINGUBANG [Senna tora]
MGLVQSPLCCHSKDEEPPSHTNSNHHLHSESSTSSISSQPSLPSVPSLTTPHPHPNPSLQPQLLTTLTASSPISSLTLHAKFLYAASSNSHIHAWPRHHPPPQNDTVVLATSHAPVKSMLISGQNLFTAHQDHRIRIWKIQFQPDDPTPYPKLKPLTSLPTLPDRISKLFSATNYVEIRRHKKSTWVHHVDAVSALALSRDHTLLYSASWDRTFKIWRTSDFKCLKSIRAHEDAINALVVSGDGVVYTGSADRKIKAWKNNGSLVGTLEKHKSAVNALALSPDGSVLYSGACDRSVLVWEKMGVVGALRGHTKAILCLVAMEDLVCSGSADGSVRIWRRFGSGDDQNKYSCVGVLEGHRKPVKCLAMAVQSSNDDDHNGGGSDDMNTSYLVYSGGLDSEIKFSQESVMQADVPFD